jgi:hypothetical protein
LDAAHPITRPPIYEPDPLKQMIAVLETTNALAGGPEALR